MNVSQLITLLGDHSPLAEVLVGSWDGCTDACVATINDPKDGKPYVVVAADGWAGNR